MWELSSIVIPTKVRNPLFPPAATTDSSPAEAEIGMTTVAKDGVQWQDLCE
jgi:hypothetical protein